MPHRLSRLCNVDRVRGDIGVVTRRGGSRELLEPGGNGDHQTARYASTLSVRITRGHIMSSANDIFLQAIQPIVDIFWTLVWTATGSTISVPRAAAPTPTT